MIMMTTPTILRAQGRTRIFKNTGEDEDVDSQGMCEEIQRWLPPAACLMPAAAAVQTVVYFETIGGT